MEGNVKVKVQTNGMITMHQGDSAVTIHPLKMRGFMPDLGLVKRRATQLKPINQRNCILKLLGKAIAEEINTVLKSECMA